MLEPPAKRAAATNAARAAKARSAFGKKCGLRPRIFGNARKLRRKFLEIRNTDSEPAEIGGVVVLHGCLPLRRRHIELGVNFEQSIRVSCCRLPVLRPIDAARFHHHGVD
jgi:hypothetical protein